MMFGFYWKETPQDHPLRTIDRTTDAPAVPLTSVYNLTRHDNHRVELKSILELTQPRLKSQVDLYLFLPTSVQLRSWSKTDLMNDFQCRTRLAVPVHQDGGASALESAKVHLKRVLTQCDDERTQNDPLLESTHPLMEDLITAAQRLAAVVNETLKTNTSQHVKALSLLHSPLTGTPEAQAFHNLTAQVRNTACTITGIRLAYSPLTTHTPHVLQLLDEYMSHLYIRYLGRLHHELERLKSSALHLPQEFFRTHWCALEVTLQDMETREAHHRKLCDYNQELAENERHREEHLAHLSQLKKFFQSTLFMDVQYRQKGQRLTEPVAVVAAALAALWAAVFQQFSTPSALQFGFQGMLLISIGVVAYVLKDRLKEWVKQTLAKKASHLLPDIEQQLFSDQNKDAEPLGTIKEWFSVKTKKDLPSDVEKLRQKAGFSAIEKSIPEDVLHYHKTLEFRAREFSPQGEPWALKESLRINLERFLRYMDDPYKDLMVLDSFGRLARKKSHRVYHFYACLQVTHQLNSQESQQPLTQVYRIVMDKTGVDRIETVS